jgi:riboflavin transporter FmnP
MLDVIIVQKEFIFLIHYAFHHLQIRLISLVLGCFITTKITVICKNIINYTLCYILYIMYIHLELKLYVAVDRYL